MQRVKSFITEEQFTAIQRYLLRYTFEFNSIRNEGTFSNGFSFVYSLQKNNNSELEFNLFIYDQNRNLIDSSEGEIVDISQFYNVHCVVYEGITYLIKIEVKDMSLLGKLDTYYFYDKYYLALFNDLNNEDELLEVILLGLHCEQKYEVVKLLKEKFNKPIEINKIVRGDRRKEEILYDLISLLFSFINNPFEKDYYSRENNINKLLIEYIEL